MILKTLQDRLDYAHALASSELLPRHYQNKPANVLVAIEWGQAIGLHPLTSINGLVIIDGTPTARASLVAALVQRAGHRIRTESSETEATTTIIRSDDPEHAHTAHWTIPKAAQAGLCSIVNGRPRQRDKNGRPMPWERYPEAMLIARSVTEAARKGAQDALYGLIYTPEELGAIVTESGDPLLDTDGEIIMDAVEPGYEPANDWVHLAHHAPDMHALRQVWRDARADGADDGYLGILAEAGHQRRTQLEAHAAIEEHDTNALHLQAA